MNLAACVTQTTGCRRQQPQTDGMYKELPNNRSIVTHNK